jgi:hypothetical protein
MKLMASSAAKARRAARLAGKAFSSGFVLGTERATRVDDQQVPEVRGESSSRPAARIRSLKPYTRRFGAKLGVSKR